MELITVTDEELELITKYRKGFRARWWHTEDLESRASMLEKEQGGSVIYDRTKFSGTLEMMVKDWDIKVGIPWDLIDMVLDVHCK